MKFILARKERMTQIWGEDGRVMVGTLLTTSPLVVTQVKTPDSKDGYAAVQVGFEDQKVSRVNKAELGHTKGKGYKVVQEFRTDDAASYEVGKEIGIDTFAVGDAVTVVGTTKGKGFQGVVKRHGFHGGRRSHGQKHSEREPGSIGGGGRAGGRVIKGMRMGGRMGGERITVKNLKIVQVDTANGYLLISGAVPGRRGTLIEIVGK